MWVENCRLLIQMRFSVSSLITYRELTEDFAKIFLIFMKVNNNKPLLMTQNSSLKCSTTPSVKLSLKGNTCVPQFSLFQPCFIRNLFPVFFLVIWRCGSSSGFSVYAYQLQEQHSKVQCSCLLKYFHSKKVGFLFLQN